MKNTIALHDGLWYTCGVLREGRRINVRGPKGGKVHVMEVMRKRIWSGFKHKFEEKFNRLNKVLKRLGKPEMKFSYENEYLVRYKFTTHFSGESHYSDIEQIREILVCDVVVVGEPVIKKNDKNYNYIGTVTFHDGVKLVNCSDDRYLDYFGDKFRENVCDHCGTIRKRNSYCLFEADGKVLQIGSTCVEQYFGIKVDKYLKAMGDVYNVVKDELDWDDFCGSRSGGEFDIPFDEIARITDNVTNGFKFWRKSEDGCGTVDEIREILKQCDYEYAKHERNISREEVVKYWEGKPQSGFRLNVLEMMKRGYATSYGLGIYVYGIYEAGKAKFTEHSNEVTNELNEHFGNVGDKIVRNLVLDKVSSFEGRYGITYVCRFHDENGRTFVWFASTRPDIDCGTKVTIKGTIKKHDEYNGTKQTVLTRCKVAA